MLILDSRAAIVDDVSVFPDHADPLQWYYLPTAPHLTVVGDDPSLQLVGYRGSREGGLLSFDVNVGLEQRRIDDLARQIETRFDLDDTPRLAPVPLVDGTVRLLMLGTDSGPQPDPDEPVEPPLETPPFQMVALHNAKPSLYDDNQASFTVTLDKGAYALVKATLDAVLLPVAVVYSLDYLALRPAYQVSLTIDWDRVQKHLDQTFGVKVLCFGSEISKVVDELEESKAIDLRADTFVPDDGTDGGAGVIDRRDAALAQVKAMITTAFFEPSLPPWTPEKPADWEKALRLISELATTQARNAALGPAGGAMDSLSFTYKRTDYTRIDKKHLDVSFSERTTVRRSIYPQGHLAALFSTIAASPDLKARLVREVTVDDTFFDRRTVQAVYRPGLGRDLIDSIDVRASYAGVPRNKLLTGEPWTADFEWLSQPGPDGGMDRDVEVSYEVNFADADSSERPASLTSPPETVTDDVVALTPEADVFAVRSVAVLAERIPWTRFDSVEVHLRHRDEAHGVDEQQLLRLTEQDPDAVWPMLVVDRDATAYEVRTVMRARQGGAGNDVDSGWSDTDEEQVTARNPYRARTLAVLADVAWTEVRDVFVDVRYTDPDHDVLVEETLHLSEGQNPPAFTVDLRDPRRTAVEYVVTFSYLDGRVTQLPPSVTYEPRLIVKPGMLGHRVVEVEPPADWAARGVERVTVELRFEDFLENLSYASRFELDSPEATARFEFDYADVARNRYEWRSTVLYANGLRQAGRWTASADPVVRPRLA